MENLKAEPKIETLREKKLTGMRMSMSFADNKTRSLWQGFMQRRKEIKNNKGTDLYSMQNYPPLFFEHFNPTAIFEKWATTEVTDFETVPEGMETFTLPGGLYAVFFFKGASSTGAPAFQYILGTWLPASAYQLDNRPHFEVIGEKYRNDDPDSEEENLDTHPVKGMMLHLNRIHHVAIICSDYPKSKTFYTEILGLTIIRETYRSERQSWKLDLSLNGEYVVELFSFPCPPERVSQPEASGLRHLAFEVEDLNATIIFLKEKNMIVEPARTDENTGKQFTFISDPDNLPIEFYQK